MSGGFLARFTSLFSYRCYERRILLDFAALRNGLVALGVLALYAWQVPILGVAAAIALAPCNGVFIALVSADWVEHYGRLLVLGYSYQPNVSARCELEGGNMPTDREAEAAWRATLYTRIAVGDDPGPGHYPYPIPTFWGRVRALCGGS